MSKTEHHADAFRKTSPAMTSWTSQDYQKIVANAERAPVSKGTNVAERPADAAYAETIRAALTAK